MYTHVQTSLESSNSSGTSRWRLSEFVVMARPVWVDMKLLLLVNGLDDGIEISEDVSCDVALQAADDSRLHSPSSERRAT
jgi:hypothetical protein